jgi:hypothetical protein
VAEPFHHLLHVEYDYNQIIICGQTVTRPSSISPKQWLDLWDDVMQKTRGWGDEQECEDCEYEEGSDGEGEE